MTDLADRYGSAPPRRRWMVLGVVGVAVVAVLGFMLWAFLEQADPQVRSRLLRYDVVSQHEVTAELTVVRSSPEVPATCRLHALAADHSVVGELVKEVRSGETSQQIQVSLRTEREAVSVISDGCTAPGQNRPR